VYGFIPSGRAFRWIDTRSSPLARRAIAGRSSSATGAGLQTLTSELLARVSPDGMAPGSEDPVQDAGAGRPADEQELAEHMVFRPAAGAGFRVERLGSGSFAVRGRGIELLLARYDIDNEDAMAYVEGRLRRIGVLKALEEEGFQPGDEIQIAGVTFELDPGAAN